MVGTWFRLENYYEEDGDTCVFYPSLYSPGYRFSAENRAAMDGVLGPFLKGRLRVEFVVLLSLITFVLMIAMTVFLVSASNEELDAMLAAPPWVWLVAAFALSGAIVAPIAIRLRTKIRQQLDEMGIDASEPARPDFFIVDGAFSRRRLSFVLFGLAFVSALAGMIAPAGAAPAELTAGVFAAASAMFLMDLAKS